MDRIATLERARTGYDEDVVAWADAQAELLRAGRLDAVDLANIIEEIEGVSGGQRAALSSQITRIIEHLLKLIYSPATYPREGWIDSIDDARRQIRALIDFSPSLRREVEQMVARTLQRDARLTAKRLKQRNEIDRDAERAIQDHGFTVDQVIGDWQPERP